MLRLVKESLNEFGKGNNPLTTMGIGYEGTIRQFFRDLNISDYKYTINKETGQIVFYEYLNLDNANITNLPDNLYVQGYLSLEENMDLTSLPENLKVAGSIYLCNTNVKQLPEGTNIMQNIYLYKIQVELRTWLENSIYINHVIFN